MVVELGETEKPAPLELVPIIEPPEDTVYHLIVLSVEIALISLEEPTQILVGLAIATEGAAGNPIEIVIGVLLTLKHEPL